MPHTAHNLMDKKDLLNNRHVNLIINLAFEEDIRNGDITTQAIIDENVQAKAVWRSKEQGIIAGLEVAERVFQKLDIKLEWKPFANDGDLVSEGDIIVEFQGSCRAVLSAERVALNFVQRMSGIATQTNRLVKKLEGLNTKILDTRKTVPGLRILDKYAVKTGGGINHRIGLFDMAMIKDNHIITAGGIANAVKQVRENAPKVKIEVETTNLSEVDEALEAGAEIIMLDNMSIKMTKKAVDRIGKKALTEASGNINEKNIREVAGTGVDFISVGALTHSVRAFDISQQVMEIL